jgi:hypothetical protein
MRFGVTMAAAAALLAVPAYVGGQDTSQLDQLITKADSVYAEKGFSPTGWKHYGALKNGGEDIISVPLSGGSQYQIIGICDTDCSNLDTHLLDSNGKEVDSDTESDDFPIVGAKGSGTYTLRVEMVACDTDPCSYAVVAYKQ